MLIEEYPDIKEAYGLCHSLRMIFSKNIMKDVARLSMARLYNKIEEAGLYLCSYMLYYYDDILNFYNNRSSNALAESFNAKIKAFRSQFRGVRDIKFFMYRFATLYS